MIENKPTPCHNYRNCRGFAEPGDFLCNYCREVQVQEAERRREDRELHVPKNDPDRRRPWWSRK